jgi:hypothetical protein
VRHYHVHHTGEVRLLAGAGAGAPQWSGIARRWRWLGHPSFLSCVILLGVNDHLLKAHYPGWWTGKLSDAAGVVVIATVAAVVAGRRQGLVLTAVGFVLLKVVPGVSELVSPFLGGVTLRDPTDLLALVVLVPVATVMRDAEGVDPPDAPSGPSSAMPGSVVDGRAAPTLRESWRRGRRKSAAAAPIVGLMAAVAITSATSCGPDPAVIEITESTGTLFALLDRGWGDTEWARSDDGGQTWESTAAPPGRATTPTRRDPYGDPEPRGPKEVCAANGTCYRLRDERVIERRSSSGERKMEIQLDDQEFEAISTGCANAQVGVLTSIAITKTAKGEGVVASLGADGVLVRQDDGQWEKRRVLGAPPITPSAIDIAAATALFVFGPGLALLLWLIGRRRWPLLGRGLAVVVAGWVVTLAATSAVLLVGIGRFPRVTIPMVAVVGAALTTAAAVGTARRPRRHPRSVRT